MTDRFSDEFVHDFVDGQLSGADLVRAESLLANDPDFLEQVKSLRELVSRVRSLPRSTLSDSFSDQVIARIDQQIEARRHAVAVETGDAQWWKPTSILASVLAASLLLAIILFSRPETAPTPRMARASKTGDVVGGASHSPIPQKNGQDFAKRDATSELVPFSSENAETPPLPVELREKAEAKPSARTIFSEGGVGRAESELDPSSEIMKRELDSPMPVAKDAGAFGRGVSPPGSADLKKSQTGQPGHSTEIRLMALEPDYLSKSQELVPSQDNSASSQQAAAGEAAQRQTTDPIVAVYELAIPVEQFPEFLQRLDAAHTLQRLSSSPVTDPSIGELTLQDSQQADETFQAPLQKSMREESLHRGGLGQKDNAQSAFPDLLQRQRELILQNVKALGVSDDQLSFTGTTILSEGTLFATPSNGGLAGKLLGGGGGGALAPNSGLSTEPGKSPAKLPDAPELPSEAASANSKSLIPGPATKMEASPPEARTDRATNAPQDPIVTEQPPLAGQTRSKFSADTARFLPSQIILKIVPKDSRNSEGALPIESAPAGKK